MKHKLIMENWRRFVNEELKSVMMEINSSKPDPAEVEKFMQTQQEGAAAAVMLFSSMFGQVADKDQNIQSPDQIQGITVQIDGDDVNVPLKALNIATDFLQKKADSGDSTATAGLKSMNDLAKAPIENINSFGTADVDGDGYLSSDVSGAFSLGNDEGGIYTQTLLKLVVDKMSQADAPTQAVDSVDTSNFDITKGQSPQGNDQLTIKLPQGKKLSQDEISKISKNNGMSSYSVANNTGLGMVFITAN